MAYIYKIVNDINGKIYIGKTNLSLQERFEDHIRSSKRPSIENRPLYSAFNKYGIEHFTIEAVEEVLPEDASNREIYWIEQYQSYHNGYNATYGGDGRTLIDYKKVLELFDTTDLTIPQIAEVMCCHKDSVKNILDNYRDENIIAERVEKSRQSGQFKGMRVKCIETDMEFPSCAKASRWLVDNGYIKSYNYGKNRIAQMCQGKIAQNTLGGFHWETIE